MADALTPRSYTRSRPYVTDYGIPEDETGMLAWSEVEQRIAAARNYWLCTAGPDTRPHAMPLWAIWLDHTLYFDGAPHTRWARNLATNPNVVVHLESGTEVVILEGTVIDLQQFGPVLYPRLKEASAAKYGGPFEDHGCFTLRPHKVLAWTSFPTDATRFTFND